MPNRMVVIYKIIFPDGLVYIGSTINLSNRISQHKWVCSKEKLPPGKRTYLSDKMKLVGFESCVFEEIERVRLCERYESETYWINRFGKDCINKSRIASKQNTGVKHTREAVNKRTDTRLSMMPFFNIFDSITGEKLHTTNSYESAYYVTGESTAGIRKKLRNGRNMTKFIYKYVDGGGLSQHQTAR